VATIAESRPRRRRKLKINLDKQERISILAGDPELCPACTVGPTFLPLSEVKRYRVVDVFRGEQV
jgi:uncharacterized protein (UPF0179 family)